MDPSSTHIETTELTLALTGLGDLDETSALALFATAQAHRITRGTRRSIRDLVNAAGEHLYPSYYATHLVVPPTRLLSGFPLWTSVSVAVDVRSFAGLVLDSHYVLDSADSLTPENAAERASEAPSMRAGSLFVIEDIPGAPRSSRPSEDCLAELPTEAQQPELARRFETVSNQRSLDPEFQPTLGVQQPFRYELAPERDAAPGRNLFFGKFTELLLSAERDLVTHHGPFPISSRLADCLETLERETHYLANCRGDAAVQVEIAARIDACDAGLHGKDPTRRSCGIVTFAAAITEAATNELLVLSSSRRLLLVPASAKPLLKNAGWLLSHSGRP